MGSSREVFLWFSLVFMFSWQVAQHYVKFPGFESVPAGFGAVTTAPGSYGFVALFLVSGAMELAVWTQDPNKEPGNFGDPLGLLAFLTWP